MIILNLKAEDKIASSINEEENLLLMYTNIYKDIINLKNPKYIMYKCEDFLFEKNKNADFIALNEAMTNLENIETSKNNKKLFKPFNRGISNRKGKEFTINKTEKQIKIEN